MPASNGETGSASHTSAEAASFRLRNDILSGAFSPGTQLKIRELKAAYGIGASPMREALMQLSASGLVQQRSQRGFRIPDLHIDELTDITESRMIGEGEALVLAIQNGGRAWEDAIVSSYHLFEREVILFYGSEEKDFNSYEDRHHTLHKALISACPLSTLKKFCDDLYLCAARYRRFTRSLNFKADEVVSEHRLLVDTVLNRDAERAQAAIRSHIRLTADVAIEALRHQKESGAVDAK